MQTRRWIHGGLMSLLIVAWVGGQGLRAAGPLLEPGKFLHKAGANPAMKTSPIGAWDDRILESGDCFKDGDTYYWYYHAAGTWTKRSYQIFVATAKSPLGPWQRHGQQPILTVSGNAHETYCVACPMVVKDGGKYHMIYLSAGDSPAGWGWSVSLASSESPLGPWIKSKANPILVHQHMGYPGGLVKVKGTWYMFGTEPDEIHLDFGRTYVATAKSLEGPWDVRDEPVISEGPKGSWDEGGFSEFEVEYYDGMFHAFYGGSRIANIEGASEQEVEKIRQRVQESIGYAYSKDGFHWTKYAHNPVIPNTNIPNAAAFAEVHTLIEYPSIYCYYTLRYLTCPQGEKPEWFQESWIEHLGVSEIRITP